MKISPRHRTGVQGPRLLLALAASMLALLACGGTSGPTPASGTPIKIGVLDDSGPATPIEGAEMRVSSDLAVAQINAAGGIHGHPLQLLYADPKNDPAEALNLAQSLVQQQQVDVLVGAVLSSECLGVEKLIARLQIVYVASTGCASEAFTGAQCDKFSFRIQPVGRQGIIPLATYIVSRYGKRWAVLYSDYAYGQSQANAYDFAMQAAGGSPVKRIAVPLGEPNVTPYITKIPTDGSIDGLIDAQVGVDLVRGTQVITQFGINQKMPIVGIFGKDRFAGVYPDSITGSLGQGFELSDAAADNPYDIAYHKAFRAQLSKEDATVVSTMGGADKAVPGTLGYQAYTAITALKEAMLTSSFGGRQDTQKLITALESLSAKRGADFPGGDVVMDKSTHQAAMTTYIVKIDGQKEEVLSTIAPDRLPPISGCQFK